VKQQNGETVGRCKGQLPGQLTAHSQSIDDAQNQETITMAKLHAKTLNVRS